MSVGLTRRLHDVFEKSRIPVRNQPIPRFRKVGPARRPHLGDQSKEITRVRSEAFVELLDGVVVHLEFVLNEWSTAGLAGCSEY